MRDLNWMSEWYRPADGDRPGIPPGPLAVEAGGRRWAVATNGHALIAVQHDGAVPPYPDAGGAEWVAGILTGSVEGAEVPFHRLTWFVGSSPGKPPAGRSPGYVAGAPVNLMLVAAAIQYLDAETVTVGAVPVGPGDGLVIDGGTWRVVVAPMREDPEDGWDRAPRFLDPAAQGA